MRALRKPNLTLAAVVAGTASTLGLVHFVPRFAQLFDLVPLDGGQLAAALLAGAAVLVATETIKRNWRLGGPAPATKAAP